MATSSGSGAAEPDPHSAPPAAAANAGSDHPARPSSSAEARADAAAWIAVPRLRDRLRSSELGLVINTADPYSVAVGEHYAARRGVPAGHVLRVELPLRGELTPAEFASLRAAIAAHFGPRVQALALAWVQPYAVACNSITGALALGLDEELCRNGCGASRASPWFNSASTRPRADLGLLPSMLLAAPSVAQARALIDRGVESDGALADAASGPVRAMMLVTDDAVRGVRARLYPPSGARIGSAVEVQVGPAEVLASATRVLLVQTGSVRAPLDPPPAWAPGGLGDHLTSTGGALDGGHGQGTALDWIASGAVASHGAVSEPCNHLQKFPHPQVLLLHYLQGATALEAYWRSVAWPQQSLFVGEPLAAPFARLISVR